MNTPISRLPRIQYAQYAAQDLIDAMPARLPRMATFATSAGARGANDTPFDRPSRRPLRGGYMSSTALPALFRVRN